MANKYILNTGRTPISLTIPPKLRKDKETRVHFPAAIGAVDTGKSGDEQFEAVPAKFFVEVDRELVAVWTKSSPAYFDAGMLKVFDARPSKTTLAEAAKVSVTAGELAQREADLARREADAHVLELKVQSDEAMLAVEKAEVALETAEKAVPLDDDAVKVAKAALTSAKGAATKARKAHEEAAKALDESEREADPDAE
jgi:hypothetical protein